MNHLHGLYLEDLSVGMQAEYAKTITETDVILFAGISGDDNPVHLNDEFAKTSRFGKRIAHGILTSSLISTVIGRKLPGYGAIYISQSLQFKAPVYIGDTVTAIAKIKEIIVDKRRVLIETSCLVQGKVVLEGEAVIMVDKKPKT